MDLKDPKLDRQKGTWFPYYAGFSKAFVTSCLDALELDPGSRLLDPWAGGGTTLIAAQERGIRADGIELNPVMLATCLLRIRLYRSEVQRVCGRAEVELSAALESAARRKSYEPPSELGTWFSPSTALRMQRAISRILELPISERGSQMVELAQRLQSAPTHKLVALGTLLAIIRNNAASYRSSNPTWISASESRDRVILDRGSILAAAHTMIRQIAEELCSTGESVSLRAAEATLASSTQLPYPREFFHAVITSPPYCTRIDYCAKTRPELAALGIVGVGLRRLRDEMLGTPTIVKGGAPPKLPPSIDSLLDSIRKHGSYAAESYYGKFFEQYFDSYQRSIREISRVLTPGAKAIMVVQNSYFKDIRIDLAGATIALGKASGLQHVNTVDWPTRRNMASINSQAHMKSQYRQDAESAVILEKKHNAH